MRVRPTQQIPPHINMYYFCTGILKPVRNSASLVNHRNIAHALNFKGSAGNMSGESAQITQLLENIFNLISPMKIGRTSFIFT